MATLKRFNENTGNWEYIQLTGEDISELKDDFTSHKDEIATPTTLGHVKVETEPDGTLIIPEPDIPKSDFEATRAPDENDDETEGYEVGSRWFDVDNQVAYDCLKADEGNAEWAESSRVIDPLTFYDEGFENESVTGGWIGGYFIENGSIEKEENYLLLKTFDNSDLPAARSFYTYLPIDFSKINTLYVDWESSEHDIPSSYFIVTDSPDQDKNNAIVKFEIFRETFNRQTNSLDVSNLNGLHFISVYAADRSSRRSDDNTLKVYKVWGEE